ncbi:hypothetical protein BO78DRAFT_142032 [Aspergillus sclerotiicarbonarius CBS 121057]|uniref:Uncharacterized protein n=1 Tax=Aspergillus sclerotiicarbonarius (strain CBS 121057 / IBT 28362) TaxID=1448318 RepID=A0A319E6S3_ASPSB|nr:hypothetical protein BO78DRAFT_142032 [Aspergillus sclerotiicarbonarius CBS 121057]
MKPKPDDTLTPQPRYAIPIPRLIQEKASWFTIQRGRANLQRSSRDFYLRPSSHPLILFFFSSTTPVWRESSSSSLSSPPHSSYLHLLSLPSPSSPFFLPPANSFGEI